MDIKLPAFGECREYIGQHAGLDLCGKVELDLRGSKLFALIIEYDAVHDDKRYQNNSVLTRISEHCSGEEILGYREEYERESGGFLGAGAAAPDYQYGCSDGYGNKVYIFQP